MGVICVYILTIIIAYKLLTAFFNKDKSVIWSPITVISLTYIYYCLMPFYTHGSLLYHVSDSSQSELFNIASLVSYVFILIGFSRRTNANFTKWNTAFNDDNIIKISVVFFFLAFAGYAAFRGVHFSIAAKDDSLELVHSGYEHYFIDLIYLYIPSFALLLTALRYKGKKKMWWALALMWYMMVNLIFTGTRARIVLLVLASACVYYIYPNVRKIKLSVVLPIGLVMYMGFSVMEYSRLYSQGIRMDRVSEMTLDDATKGAEENNSVYWYSSLVMQKYSEQNKFVGFEPLLTAILMPIPRAIAPWKPDGNYLFESQRIAIGNDTGGAIFLNFTEAYISFWWIGVIIYALVLGRVSRLFWDNYVRNPNSLGAVLALALFSAVSYSIISRGDLSTAFINFVYVVCLPFWLALAYNKKILKK